MKTLRGFLLSTTVLALGIAIIGEASAAQDKVRLKENLNEHVYGSKTLRLGKLFRLGQYKGYELKRIVLRGTSYSRHTNATLFMGGRQVGSSQYINKHQDKTVFHVSKMIGQGRRGLQMDIEGDMFINKVVAVLKSPQSSRVEIIRNNIYRHISGPETLPIRKISGLVGPSSRGKKVKFVSLYASSARGRAKATLLINGQPTGYTQTIPTYTTELRFELPQYQNELGYDVKKLQIEVRGRSVDVEEIAVGVQKDYFNGGGHHGPRTSYLSQDVHQILAGYEAITPLAPMMSTNRATKQKQVVKVTINAKAARGNGSMQICEKSNYGYGTINCTNVKHIPQRHSTQVFFTQGALKNLVLVTSGRVVLKKIDLELKGSRY